jgi:endoglucanase
MTELLKELCLLGGASGREDAVRGFIIPRLGDASYTADALGNLIVDVKGRKRAKNRVMLCAHMDEVGVMVTYVHTNGLLSFCTVGGVRGESLAGKAVVFENGAAGVIGLKPMHLCSPDEREAMPDAEALLIDIGAENRAAAEKIVSLGDTAVFAAGCEALGEHRFLSKAIDDRAGCAVLLDMIRAGVEYDLTVCFCVQEEVGLRGSKAAAYAAAPDFAIVLEATTAADVADAEGPARVCVLGEGPAVSLMDRATVYPPAMYRKIFEIAAENGLKAQPKTMVAGGNDAGSVHVSRAGVPVAAISLPCRYIHSSSSVCDLRDLAAMRVLAEKAAAYFANADRSAL